MSRYGIDWNKVDSNTRLDAVRPEVTAVTEQAARPKSTRAKREAKPDTVVRSQRRQAVEAKTPVVKHDDGTVEKIVIAEDEGIDLVVEDENGEKIDGSSDEDEE